MPQQFDIATHIDGSVVWLRLDGELDAATAPQLSAAIDAVAGAGHEEVVLDCHELRFIDSSGLNVLVAAHTGLRDAGATLVVARPPAAARRLFGITGLDRVLIIRE